MYDSKFLERCRFCDSDRLFKYIDLGALPLPNGLLNTPDQEYMTYDHSVSLCQNCKMSMLDIVVDPNILYKNYLYRSGMSTGFREHCTKLSDEIIKLYQHHDAFIVDIASNDCTFLKTLKACNNRDWFYNSYITNLKMLGVDPAKNLCELAEKEGIRTYNQFFNYQTSLNIRASWGEADVITVQNCFAHVDEIWEFMGGIKTLLKKDGLLIIEVPWVARMIESAEIGSVYLEHLSYVSVTGMRNFIKNFGMYITDIKYFPDIHTGTMRFYIKNKPEITNLWVIDSLCYREQYFFDRITEVQPRLEAKKQQLLELVKKEGWVIGIGQAAKATIVCNFCDLSQYVSTIYDNTKIKQGKYQPGTSIPILPMEALKASNINTAIVFPWNIQDEVVENARIIRPDLKFIQWHPEVKFL